MMEPKQPTVSAKPLSEMTPQERHERAIGVLKRLVADKHQAEEEMVENFHKDPAIQAAVAKLKEENERRGTPVVQL
ncbi:hypothetical protein [Spirosoma validum]|uniref:Uncharacterized protein n=1 Tax=Spirosoma validum TaxID=2771355 RepID=A0A927AY02_9BACT|nr:hypothetical protein [Spirosoma validum]MBD2751830.1 hypothetical protein [Spirosoma validum]